MVLWLFREESGDRVIGRSGEVSPNGNCKTDTDLTDPAGTDSRILRADYCLLPRSIAGGEDAGYLFMLLLDWARDRLYLAPAPVRLAFADSRANHFETSVWRMW